MDKNPIGDALKKYIALHLLFGYDLLIFVYIVNRASGQNSQSLLISKSSLARPIKYFGIYI